MTKPNICLGYSFKTREGCQAVVVDYINYDNVVIEFQDKHKYQVKVSSCKIKSGGIKNPYHPSVVGVAYLGFGKYKTSHLSKHTKAYIVWRHMIRRCHDPKVQARNPTYIGCTVAEDWLCFQNFAEWYVNHEFYDMGYELDKDILVEGNKVYSPETCTLIPSHINSLLLHSKDGMRPDGLPMGVTTHHNTRKFITTIRLSEKDKVFYAGNFDTPEDAHRQYVVTKTKHVRAVARASIGLVEDAVVESLFEWCNERLKRMEIYCEQVKSLRSAKQIPQG